MRFAIALLAIAVVFTIDLVADAAVDDRSHFLLLGTAVLATAWFAGTGPAIAATVVGAIGGALQQDLARTGVADEMHLALFVVQGLLLTGIVSELRNARRAAEEQARAAEAARKEGEAANRMKDEFLATVSHELRTPLNAVLGWVHLLRTGKLDGPTANRGMDSIDRNVRLQAQLTADLLDVSKALTGRLQLECQPIAFFDAVQQAVHALGPAARAKGVEVRLAPPDRPVAILGDFVRLRQVSSHLVANAIKFTPRGGSVDVSVEAAAEEARLTVSDSGRGIDPAFLPRVFDRFTQADPSPTRVSGGLGVGLSLVRELVELHGGEIEARNREDRGGAVFIVKLPLQPADALGRSRAMPVVTLGVAESPPLDGLRVLVLDHEDETRELLRTVLQQRGATVRAVGTVAEALEVLEAWRPDVLVSDSASSDRDSYVLVGKVQSLDADRGGRIPAIALTAFARADQQMGQMLADVQCDIPKPVEPAVLTAEVARLAGRERRRAQR